MPQRSYEPLHPAAPSPEQALAHLAVAVLASLVSDLESPHPKHRQEARNAVAAGVRDVWLDVLDLADHERARVLSLLRELAH